jgi:hypothetical protein
MKTSTKIAAALAGFLLAAIVPATVGQDKAPVKDATGSRKGLRVFVCGHSLHWYIPTPLGELAKAAGIEEHQLAGQQSLGGSKTQQHWDVAEAKNKAKQALKTGKVDVFTMAPIQFPDPGIEQFVKLGLEHNPKMRFTVQISWGGSDIDNQDFPIGVFGAKTNWNKTPEQLKQLFQRNIKAAEAQADELNKKYGQGKKVVLLVPSAQANIALRTKIANKELPGLTSQDELYRDPIGHPTAPLEAVNTYLHFAVIYNQSPVGLAMPGILKNAKKAAWDEKFNRTLQELAWEIVSNYSYSGVTAAPAAKGKGLRSATPQEAPTKEQPAGKQTESGSGPYKAIVVGEPTLPTVKAKNLK